MNISEKPRFVNGMPDSAGNIEVIQSSLKASLGGRDRDRLDEDVAAASKRVLLHNIEFLPASAPYSIQRDTLRAKYIPLNSAPTQSRPWGDGSTPQHQAMTSSAHSDKNGDSLPSPRVVLYPEEKVKMEWSRMTRIGAGLVNMGNTCFFNSTLQCLTYTAPLVNYCFTNDHREKCKKKDFCMMCEVQDHIRTSLDCGGRSIKPHSMLQKLRCIAKHMKWGRQEDAHEFLRFLVDHLQQSCLHGETKLDRFSKETTVINQIFGGYLRSQVTCLRCQGKSNTFDPFMDLSLDIKGVNTVEDALLKYVKPETLDNDNAYKCPKCKNKVRAQKRFTIQKAPNVLTLQLNRFDFNRHLSGKINRFIRYPEKVNLRNFMSQKQGEPVLYHLYGVVVHSGHSSDHGHYYSYVKSPSKTWYCMNDSSVHQVNANTVFNSDAYVLFYARINRNISAAHSGPNNVHAKNSSPVKVPFSSVMIQNHLKQEKTQMVNGIHGKATSELGTPIKRQQPAGSSLSSSSVANGPKIVPHGTSPSALPGAHNKISFPILTPQQKKQLHLQQQKDDGKRIVLQIKHGNSTTMEKSPDGKSKVVNGGGSNKPAAQLKSSGLVPYNDDSDSEQENNSAGGNSVRLNKSPHHRTTDVASTSSSASGGSYIQASGDHHHHHNYASVRSIPLPSDSGDGHKSGISSTHKTSVSSDMQNLSQTKDGSRSPHVHQMHSQNGIKQSPRSSDTHRWKGSSSPSSSSQHSWVSKKVNAQGNTATTTTTSTTTSSTTTTRAPLTRSPPHVAGDGDDDDDDDHSSPWPTPSIEINDKHGTPPQRRPVLTYCKETVRDDMRWPRTRFGHVARRNCSGGQTGVAKWQCLSTGWFKFGPDLSDCVSVWLDAQLKSVESETPVNEAAAELSESVKSRPMTSGDLKLAATKMLPTLGKGLQRDMGVIPPMLRKRRMKKFKKDVMNTGSHLLSEDNQESWQGLSRQDRVWSATSLLLSMEDTGFQSAAVMDLGASEVTVDENIVMEVSVLDTGTSQRDVVFPSSSSLAHTPWSTSSDSITLTRDSVREAGGTGRLNVVFSIYRNMNELIQPEDNKLPSMPSDPDFNSGTIRDSEKDGKRRQPSVIVNTNIISASVHGRRPGMRLADPVRFTLHHLQPNNEAVPACSFWDVDQSAKSGRWSQDGCRMLDTNLTHTTCECDHLTNFAVLMDISGTELSRDAELGLIWVTYIGCALSIICLLLAWITFTVFKNLQCDRNTIHKNLVLTLMLAELVFLAGIAQVEHKILCSIIAGVLHFLFLSAFAWMCLEGVQLYVMLVEVFEQERSRLPWYYLFGYGTPVIIVAVSAGVNYQGYGTDKHCWLSTENHFIWSFVGPVLVVMLVNIVMLGIAIYIMCRHSNMSATMKERSKVTKFRAWVKGAVVLMVLLGVTWLVGLLFLNKHMVVMAYLFTILNSLQGLFIFLFHCIMNEKVQKEYRKVARRTSWLPDCIRINYGGYNGGATTSPNASSGSGNFLSRLFGQGRKQSAASTNSSARPFLQKDAHLRSDGENSSSRDNSTAPSSLNGYVYNPQMYSNGHSKAPLLMNNNGGVKGSNNGQLLTPCYETLDGVAGDLSEYLECSVVNSEFVSEYCQDNMQVSQERRRYSTGSEDSEMMSSQLPVPHVMDHDNLSNLSVASSTRKPASFAMTSDLGDHADLDDPNYEEPLPGDGQLDLLQYIIPAKKRNGEEEDSGCDTTQDRRTRVCVGENRHLSPAAAAASEGKSSSLNKLTKPAGLSLSSIPETTDPSSPQHSSTPNLQFVPGYVAPLPHATSSPITNGPPDMSLFPSAVAAACPVVSSPDSDKSSLPNLAVDPLTVEVTDNGSHDSDHKKRHSSGADLQFSPFKFSSSDC
ncbi:uncharacterized protein LOC101864474 isoform X2 [Aplysia californica]|uniref:Uncharacterized protein LOC101864474 isoform X2 n=1 Tax=Aplysia californica TaxID=6500 RepID=A0ABM1A673_APLCA|nr:uncharacterized protein LOC101864474 isoform X2 [Aplysia californica]